MRDMRELRGELSRCACKHSCCQTRTVQKRPFRRRYSCTRLVVRATHIVLNGSFLFTSSFLLKPTKISPCAWEWEGNSISWGCFTKRLQPKTILLSCHLCQNFLLLFFGLPFEHGCSKYTQVFSRDDKNNSAVHFKMKELEHLFMKHFFHLKISALLRRLLINVSFMVRILVKMVIK